MLREMLEVRLSIHPKDEPFYCSELSAARITRDCETLLSAGAGRLFSFMVHLQQRAQVVVREGKW